MLPKLPAHKVLSRDRQAAKYHIARMQQKIEQANFEIARANGKDVPFLDETLAAFRLIGDLLFTAEVLTVFAYYNESPLMTGPEVDDLRKLALKAFRAADHGGLEAVFGGNPTYKEN